MEIRGAREPPHGAAIRGARIPDSVGLVLGHRASQRGEMNSRKYGTRAPHLAEQTREPHVLELQETEEGFGGPAKTISRHGAARVLLERPRRWEAGIPQAEFGKWAASCSVLRGFKTETRAAGELWGMTKCVEGDMAVGVVEIRRFNALCSNC